MTKGYRTQSVIPFKVGDFRLWILSDGYFRLDGGSMFGVVPKVLWAKSNRPDRLNRILMGLSSLLVDCGDELVLIDPGIGDKLDEKLREIYSVVHRPSLERSLAEAGFSRGDVTMIVNTHLHFDHAGGSTIRDTNGNVVPAFPSATYVVQEGEWQEAQNRSERNRWVYLGDDFLPLQSAGVLRLVNGEVELVKGIRLVPTPGHTQHHYSVLISSQGEHAFYASDLVPMAAHVPYRYIMAYDLYPMETLRKKKEILPRAYKEAWQIVFVHDPVVRVGVLEQGKEGFVARTTSSTD